MNRYSSTKISFKEKSVKKVLLLILSIFLLTGCTTNTNKIEDDIYSHKTKYIGDASKVVSIVSKIEYPEGSKYHGIEIDSSEEPYKLDVKLNTDQKPDTDKLLKTSVMTFALVDNLSVLNYIDSSTNEVFISYDRRLIDKTLEINGEKNTKEIGSNEDNFYNYMKK